MLPSAIPVKTQAGRLEIDERKLKIGARQRMVLISINGERPVSSIRQQFAAMNEIDSVLDELLANGLIEVPQAAVPAPAAATSPAAVVAEIEVELPEPAKPKTKAKAEAKAKAKPEAAPPPVEAKPSMGFDPLLQAAREYMSRTLIAKAGLRSFLFAQKIEKCPSRDALREMLPEFRRVLRKHVDAGKVAEFSAQAEAMLG